MLTFKPQTQFGYLSKDLIMKAAALTDAHVLSSVI